jgi:hypothetical protein
MEHSPVHCGTLATHTRTGECAKDKPSDNNKQTNKHKAEPNHISTGCGAYRSHLPAA